MMSNVTESSQLTPYLRTQLHAQYRDADISEVAEQDVNGKVLYRDLGLIREPRPALLGLFWRRNRPGRAAAYRHPGLSES
jgi:hypothetical protein